MRPGLTSRAGGAFYATGAESAAACRLRMRDSYSWIARIWATCASLSVTASPISSQRSSLRALRRSTAPNLRG